MDRRRESEPGDGENGRTSLEMLVQPLVRLWRNLNRRTARFVGATWRLMFPYSSRSIRRRRWRAGVLALCVALSIVVFGLFESHFAATHLRFRGRVETVPLAADLVARREAAWSAAEVHRLNFMPDVDALDVGMAVEVYSPVGHIELLALDPGFFAPREGEGGAKPSAGLGRELTLTAGTPPEETEQVLVPASAAEAAGLQVGEALPLEYRGGDGQLFRATYQVAGMYRAEDPLLQGLLTVLPRPGESEALPPLAGLRGERPHPGGNAVFLLSDSPGRLRGELGRVLPGADVLTPERGQEMTGSLLGDVFAPGRVVILLALLFSGLGVLNALLLTFLERQRELGIFKALGTLNDEVRIMLWQEGFLTAVVGIAIGVGLTRGLVWLLDTHTAASYVLPPTSLALAVGAALVVFYAGAILPGLMARNMTVEDLLQRRNIL